MRDPLYNMPAVDPLSVEACLERLQAVEAIPLMETTNQPIKTAPESKMKPFVPASMPEVVRPGATIYQMPEPLAKVVSWSDRCIDMRIEYPSPKFILEYNGMKFFTIGDIIVIKGKPKKGKSHLMMAFIVAILSGAFIGINHIDSEPLKILYVDCEMHENYTALLARKVHSATGWNTRENNLQLTVLNLKQDAPAERERIIKEAIRDINPTIVFIDGVKDLTRTEPNDQTEAKRIGEELKQWTGKYKCMIAVAIHENKKDEHSRGAVGASVEEIASEVWRIDRDSEGLFTASQTLFRYHSPVENLCFTMDEHGKILPADGKPKISPEEKKMIDMRFAFQEIFTNNVKLSFSSLREDYMKVKKVKKTAAYNAIMWAFKNQIIVKNLIGLYELSNLTSPHITSHVI